MRIPHRRKGNKGQEPRRYEGHGPSSGFALLELTIALVVLTIGLVSLMQAGSQTQALTRENREQACAQNALRTMADRFHSRSDGLVRSAPDTWAASLTGLYGPGGTIGNTFEVGTLNRVDSSPVGSILIVTDEHTSDADLGLSAGMPRDLDGDGIVNSSDVSASATKLPVILEVRWKGFRGIHALKHVMWVTGI